jgi:hypothetical protein
MEDALNRFVANQLIIATLTCASCSAGIAQRPNTEERINQSGEEVMPQVVTTEIREDQMKDIARFLGDFSLHNQNGELFSIILLRSSAESDSATQEQITLSAQALFQRANPKHCLKKFPSSKTVSDYHVISTSVWCQNSNYEQAPKSQSRLEWDVYWYNNAAAFAFEVDDALRCYKSNGDPDLTYLKTLENHRKICRAKH